MKTLAFIGILLFTACAAPKPLYKGVYDGVEISYHWNHRKERPSELILTMRNIAEEDRRVSVVIDLYHQGRTVEELLADTCIRVGQTMSGKLSGIFFVPELVTTEQIKSGDVDVDMTRTFVEPLPCE